VTEAIWQHFAKPKGSKDLLMVQRWPRVENRNQKIENRKFEFEAVIELIAQIRAQRASSGVEAGQTISVAVSTDKSTAKLLSEYAKFAERSTRCTLEVSSAGAAGLKVSYQLPVDEAKVARERQGLEKYITSLKAKLDDQYFVARAPAEVVGEQRRKLAEAQQKLDQN
jgi:valyl-tRNA synthetase